MGANRRIVQQREDGRWEVKAPRADRASAIADTQSAAIDRARDILSNDAAANSRSRDRTAEFVIRTPCRPAMTRTLRATVGRPKSAYWVAITRARGSGVGHSDRDDSQRLR